MADWKIVVLAQDGTEVSSTVQADDLTIATEMGMGQVPEGGSLLSVSLITSEALQSGIAKLVDLGLTPDEAVAVAGAGVLSKLVP